MPIKNQIDMTTCQGAAVVDILADVDFTVNPMSDVASALQQVILDRCKDRVPLQPGKYNVRLLAVITSENND